MHTVSQVSPVLYAQCLHMINPDVRSGTNMTIVSINLHGLLFAYQLVLHEIFSGLCDGTIK